jgi:hypothetical protein
MPLDEKDIATVAEIIAKAMAEQQEAIKKTVSEQANGAVTKALKPIREKLDLVPTKEEAAGLADQRIAQIEEERKTKANAAGKDPKDVELETLKARLDASEKRALKDAQERKETEERARRTEERSATQQALVSAGLIPELVGPAVSHLVGIGSIARDKDGKISFARKGEFGDELLSLDDGIASYLKTPEGMAMLPPRNAGGSGDPKGGKGGSGGGSANEMTVQRAAEIFRSL